MIHLCVTYKHASRFLTSFKWRNKCNESQTLQESMSHSSRVYTYVRNRIKNTHRLSVHTSEPINWIGSFSTNAHHRVFSSQEKLYIHKVITVNKIWAVQTQLRTVCSCCCLHVSAPEPGSFRCRTARTTFVRPNSCCRPGAIQFCCKSTRFSPRHHEDPNETEALHFHVSKRRSGGGKHDVSATDL